MITNPAAVHAICADPHDDFLRLQYADWLEENGDEERAELIRIGCELATGQTCGYEPGTYGEHFGICSCKRCRLRRRERELQSVPLKVWRVWCYPIVDLGVDFVWTMKKGFVESVSCTLQDWLDHGAAIVRAQPVTKIHITDKKPRIITEEQYWGYWGWSWISDEDWDTSPLKDLHHALPDHLWETVVRLPMPSEQAALDALCDTCLLHTRRQTGLPELKGGDA